MCYNIKYRMGDKMEVNIADFNDVNPMDRPLIKRYDRSLLGFMQINDENSVDIYALKLSYYDGKTRFVRVLCEHGTSAQIGDSKSKDTFFFERLFGKDGLFVKERRNDYIFLGGINKKKSVEVYPFSRFNIDTNSGKSMQELVDEMLKRNIYPGLSFEKDFDFDVVDNQFFFHTGTEDMNEVFKNGLRSRFGASGVNGFAQLTSTFYPADCILNSLHDSVKKYYNRSSSIGYKVFVLKIPYKYRGYKTANGDLYPPMPTHKLIDYSTGDSFIIPELIYGMYDTSTDKFYKNPYYNPNYNPNGLVYDQEVAQKFRDFFPGDPALDWYNFMESRQQIPYNQLKEIDEQQKTFADICSYYGIIYNPPFNF